MLRFLRIVSQVLVLAIVALASIVLSMRLAIHGREVSIPDFRGLTSTEAELRAAECGLQISTDDHFYSPTVAAGHILSQQPPPGNRVRRGWHVQAALSLGPQMSEIPTVTGQSARAAEIDLRRRGLELGASAELPTSAVPPETVLAQTPAGGAQNVVSPKVSLLYAAAPAASEIAYAMPDLTGLSLGEATRLIQAAGLKLQSATLAPIVGPAAPTSSLGWSFPTPVAPAAPTFRPFANSRSFFSSHMGASRKPANNVRPAAAPPTIPPTAVISSQTPTPGSRVTAATPITLQLLRP